MYGVTGSTYLSGEIFIPYEYKYYTASGGYCNLTGMSAETSIKTLIPESETRMYSWQRHVGTTDSGQIYGTQYYTFYKE